MHDIKKGDLKSVDYLFLVGNKCCLSAVWKQPKSCPYSISFPSAFRFVSID